MMSHGNSKTEQLLQQQSYRKHRQRLADIRHIITTQDFKLPPRYRIGDKRRQMVEKARHQQIDSEHNILQPKIDSLKAATNTHLLHEHSIEGRDPQFGRYAANFQDDRLEVNQNGSEGQAVKVIIPGVKLRAQSFTSKGKGSYLPWVKPQLSTKYESNKLIDKKVLSSKEKRSQSFNATLSQKVIGDVLQKKERSMFIEPERNERRQILHKGSLILSAQQSCLLELSLLQDRMLLAGYLMGTQNHCIKQILSADRTLQLMQDWHGRYDQFCAKVTLEQINQRYEVIRFPTREPNAKVKEKAVGEEVVKEKAKVQQEFLKRNYYTLLKNEEEISLGKKDKPTISHQKVQQIVERLAAPKTYVPNPPNVPRKTLQPPQPSRPPTYPEYPASSKIIINVDGSRLAEKKSSDKSQEESKIRLSQLSFKQSYKQSAGNQPQRYPQHKITIKRTDSMDYSKQSRSAHKLGKDSLVLSSMAKEVQKKGYSALHNNIDEQGVEYLDGQDQYGQEQFENPSALAASKQSGLATSKQESNPSKLTLQNKSVPKRPKDIQDNAQASAEYAQEFEQNYDETFDLQPNPPATHPSGTLPPGTLPPGRPVGKQKKQSKQASNQEDEYGQSFQA